MNSFDKLDEVRSVARARSTEDFEYFVNHVLGHTYPHDLCTRSQKLALAGRVIEPLPEDKLTARQVKDLQDAVVLWQDVLQGKVSHSPCESFSWIFAEELRRTAA